MTLQQAALHSTPTLSTSCEESLDTLVVAATDGKVSTFDDLVWSYKHAVLAIGRRMSGNASDAEDIAQQTFMKVYTNLATFRKESAFSTWLVSIARNEALMWKRKHSRRKELPLVASMNEGDEAPATMDVPDQGPDPESLCFIVECTKLLKAEIARLNPEMQMALQCCDLQENSVHKAAQLLGTTSSVVKTRRRRARLMLRERLERHHLFALTGSTSFK